MKRNRVIAIRKERKEKIESLINQASKSLNLKPDLSEGLLNELTDLVEWPDLIVGKFSEEFLDLPVEVLSTVMKSHQRYVPLLLKNKSFSKLDLSSEKILVQLSALFQMVLKNQIIILPKVMRKY